MEAKFWKKMKLFFQIYSAISSQGKVRAQWQWSVTERLRVDRQKPALTSSEKEKITTAIIRSTSFSISFCALNR